MDWRASLSSITAPQQWIPAFAGMTIRVVAAAFILALTPVAARPALWQATDADTTIYLFGTIHVLPKAYSWRDQRIDRAIATSQTLTLEVITDRAPEKIAQALQTLGRSPGLPPLLERVPPARRNDLTALITRSGISPALLDGYETWAAAVLLTGASLADIGLTPGRDNGVEGQITASFRAAGKSVEELESPAQQLGYFDALPEAQQRAFLLSTLDDPVRARRDYDAMLRAWSRGDTPGILKALAADPEFTPELREALLHRRNAAWTDLLARRMAQPGITLVAVGAGHLAGPDSVQAMLEARGLKVTRIR